MKVLEIVGGIAGVLAIGLFWWWRLAEVRDEVEGKDLPYDPWDKDGNLKQ